MKKLDTTKQHGVIVGTFAAIPTARYQQGGVFFDINGNEIKSKTEPEKDIIDSTEDITVDTEGNEGEKTLEATETTVANEVLKMEKTDEELVALAANGMAALRQYADKFGVKGISKSEIIEELQALR